MPDLGGGQPHPRVWPWPRLRAPTVPYSPSRRPSAPSRTAAPRARIRNPFLQGASPAETANQAGQAARRQRRENARGGLRPPDWRGRDARPAALAILPQRRGKPGLTHRRAADPQPGPGPGCAGRGPPPPTAGQPEPRPGPALLPSPARRHVRQALAPEPLPVALCAADASCSAAGSDPGRSTTRSVPGMLPEGFQPACSSAASLLF